MQLDRGQQLGEYRIVEPIGAGGMGEVYRAHDARLERDVAIKILPGTLARDPNARARFEREARAIAALSHPNILAIHDFGSVDGTWYVVTELLEGETLRERLERGAQPPRKAAELGRQMAAGLAAAHDKGIVHRDLKPENLFVTGDGRVKILDFGLAAERGAGQPSEKTQGATRTELTAPGTVLGTVAYMSPEQVRGEPADPRSDIFSFGAVLHEMIAGKKAFRRDTPAESMTAILKEEPPELAALAGDVPPALANIVRRCLEKRVGERFQSAHDLAFSLEALSSSSLVSAAHEPMAGRAARPRLSLGRAAGLLGLGAAVGIAAGAWWMRPTPYTPPTYQALTARRGAVTDARFTPDERSVVYSAVWDGGDLEVFTVAPDGSGTRRLDFDGATLFDVGPGGELALGLDRRITVGWESLATLAVATAEGSAPRPLLENVMVADWSPDGKSLAVAHEVDGRVRLEYPIGTALYESPGWISALRVHPDGGRVAFADNPIRGDNTSFVRVVDTAGTVETLRAGGAWGVIWTPDGDEVVFSNGTSLFRQRPGHPARRFHSAPNIIRLLDAGASGDLLVSTAESQREMFGRAPDGTVERNLSWLDWTTPSALLPDGRAALFEEGNQVDDDGYAIYMRDTDGSAPVPLGSGSVVAVTPDARWVVSVAGVLSPNPRMKLIPTGPGETLELGAPGDIRVLARASAWIPRSETAGSPGSVVLAGSAPDAPVRVWVLDLVAGATPRPITPDGFTLALRPLVVSPDGKDVLVTPTSGPAVLFPIAGGDPRPVAGLGAGEIPLAFDREGRHLYVQTTLAVPSTIVRIDLRSGVRAPWLELSPADPAGVFTADYAEISEDGRAYIYSTRRTLQRVFVIGGLL